MTEPRTEAGERLLDGVVAYEGFTARAGRLHDAILAIEAEASAPSLDEGLRALIEQVEAACPVCGGEGWVIDHNPEDPTGQTPMQVTCWDAEHSVILNAALARALVRTPNSPDGSLYRPPTDRLAQEGETQP